MAKMSKMPPMVFEKSKKDKESKGMKEGSKREEAMDRKQSKKMPAYKKGGVMKAC